MTESFPKEWVDQLLDGRIPRGFLSRNASDKPRIHLMLEATEISCFANPDFILRIFLVRNYAKQGLVLRPAYFREPGESLFFSNDFIDPCGCVRMFSLEPRNGSSSLFNLERGDE